MEGNRLIGGLWCSEVLANLSDYLDGDLDAGVVAKVESHLESCPNCRLFGADMAALAAALPSLSETLPEDVDARLRQALKSLA